MIPSGTLEESEPPADVVHLVAEHGHPIAQQVGGDRLDVVDAERKVVVAPTPEIRGVLTRIFRRHRIELEQLDLETRLASFEREGDVLRPSCPACPCISRGDHHRSSRRVAFGNRAARRTRSRSLRPPPRWSHDPGCGAPSSSSPASLADRTVIADGPFHYRLPGPRGRRPAARARDRTSRGARTL